MTTNKQKGQKKKPELLSPAGDLEKLRFAVAYGADAVYLGGNHFSLREKSNNFSLAEIKEAISFCHDRGKKVYVAVNIFAHNDDLKPLAAYLKALAPLNPDALLISDPGVLLLAKEAAPEIPVHISTQANNVNWKTVSFWQACGVERVVLGRELSLEEIREIGAKTDISLEMFVHGAMCMAYSGRCLLSNYLTARDANRGQCSHPCRWQYALVEKERPGEYLPLTEDGRGSYIMNSKDLNLLSYLPDLWDSGIDALKIEGRVKSSYYVAVVTKVYRAAIDCLEETPEKFRDMLPFWQEELETVSHRAYTTGFLAGKPQGQDHRYDTGGYERLYDFVAVVRGYDEGRNMICLEQRNHFGVGETLEFVFPQGENLSLTVTALYDEKGAAIVKAPHAQMTVYLPYATPMEPLTILRRKKNGT